MLENLIAEKVQRTYTYKEVLEASVAYFRGDELAATTWIKKYALRTKTGAYLELNPDDMHRRMAREFARIEHKYDTQTAEHHFDNLSEYGLQRTLLTENKVYQLFKEFGQVIPQGSVMYGLGNTEVIASLSNCIVVPAVEDSYGGIFHTDQQMAQLFKRRCGVGTDLSKLRPRDAGVSNAAGSTTGAVSFMHRFSNTTREVAQNGRRGALMLTMDIAHPDIEEFISVKQDLSKVTGANISVRISDEFMQAVVSDSDFTLRWPIDSSKPKVKKVVKAKDIWNLIIKSAHNTAEPGIIFEDNHHNYSPDGVYPQFKGVTTNPCGKILPQVKN